MLISNKKIDSVYFAALKSFAYLVTDFTNRTVVQTMHAIIYGYVFE